MRAHFKPAHLALGWRGGKKLQVLQQGVATLGKRGEGRAEFIDRAHGGAGSNQRALAAGHGGLPGGGRQAFGRGVQPGAHGLRACRLEQVFKRLRGISGVGLQTQPVHQAARRALGLFGQIAAQRQHLAGAPLAGKKVHADVVELVRLVKHHGGNAGQQLGHARGAHAQIGKKQVVVDHDHVGLHGLLARQLGVAVANLRAAAAQAVVAGGGDQRDDGRALVQLRHFGNIA